MFTIQLCSKATTEICNSTNSYLGIECLLTENKQKTTFYLFFDLLI